MAFKKGRAKTGGRTRGTKNKLNLGVAEALQARGKDCVAEMIDIADNTDKEEIKLGVYKELLKYVYPQRKAVEFAQEIELPVINIKGV